MKKLQLLIALLAVALGISCSGAGEAITTGEVAYSVTYDGNGNIGGYAPADGTNYLKGQTVTIKENTGGMTGNGVFTGWCTTADGTGTTYTPEQTFTIEADTTLYAKWSIAPTYAVTYSDNSADSGSVPLDSTRYEVGQDILVRANTKGLSRSGFDFGGWNTMADGSGITYQPGTPITVSGDITLYARWTQGTTYSISYHGNGNTGGSAPKDTTRYEEGTFVPIRSNTGNLVKSGHLFEGWNTKADGTGTTYTHSVSYIMGSADVTLYAQWKSNPTFTVTYIGNGNTAGAVPVDSTAYFQGDTVTVFANTGTLENAGKQFDGWNTKADGSGITYGPGSTFKMGSGNISLYAKWNSVPEYNFNGSLNVPNRDPIMPGESTAGVEYGFYTYGTQISQPEFSDMMIHTFVLKGNNPASANQVAAHAEAEKLVKRQIFEKIRVKSMESRVEDVEFIDLLPDAADKTAVFSKESDLDAHLNRVSGKLANAKQNLSSASMVCAATGAAKVSAVLAGAAEIAGQIRGMLNSAIGRQVYSFFYGGTSPNYYTLHIVSYVARYHVKAAYQVIVGPGLKSVTYSKIPSDSVLAANGWSKTNVTWHPLSTVVFPQKGYIAYMEDQYLEDENENPITTYTPEYEISLDAFSESVSNALITGYEYVQGVPTTTPIYGPGDIKGCIELYEYLRHEGPYFSYHAQVFGEGICTSFPHIYYKYDDVINPSALSWSNLWVKDYTPVVNKIRDRANAYKGSLPQNSDGVKFSSRNDITVYNGYNMYKSPDANMTYRLLTGRVYFKYAYKSFVGKRRVISEYKTGEQLINDLNARHQQLMARYPFRKGSPLISQVEFYEWTGTQFFNYEFKFDSTLNRYTCPIKGW